MKEMAAGSLCAGIGGFEHKAPEGVNFIWGNEMDRWVARAYRHNHPGIDLHEGLMENFDWFPPIDLLVAGFPCQPFSLAGKKMGFKDLRGQVIFHILNIVEQSRPSLVVLENVKNLTSKKYSEWMDTILGRFGELVYESKWQILNTADVANIPQNRERVYTVLLRIGGLDQSNFPSPVQQTVKVSELLEDEGNFSFYHLESKIGSHLYAIENPNPETVYQWRRTYVRTNAKG